MEFQNIIVPVNGSAVDEETVKLACRMPNPIKPNYLLFMSFL
jgi:hypothetical protein